jgi:hypothetical protein
MLAWLQQNWGTIAVLAVLAVIVGAIVICRVRARRQGKSTCGCGCEHCASRGICHIEKKEK